MPTLNDYTQAIFRLFPTGMAVPSIADDSNLKTLFEVIGTAMLNAETEADNEASDIMPDSSGNYLTDWERVLGLPLPGLEGLPTEQRLAMVKNWLNISEFSNAEFFINIAAAAGYTITITEFEPTFADLAKADLSKTGFDGDAYYYFQVNAAASTPVYARADIAKADLDKTVFTGNDALEFLIKFFKPAHAIVLFNYT